MKKNLKSAQYIIPAEVVEKVIQPSTVIVPEKIKPIEETQFPDKIPFDIVIEDDVFNDEDPALKKPIEIAEGIYQSKVEEAPGYFNLNHPEGIPELLIDADGNSMDGVPFNKAYMTGVDPARIATSNIASAAMHGHTISVEEVNTYRGLIKANFSNVANQIIDSMFQTISQTLREVLNRTFDLPLEDDGPFYIPRFLCIVDLSKIPTLDKLVDLSSYRAMVNDQGEINAVITENTIAPHAVLIVNVIEMEFLKIAATISNRSDLPDAEQRFFELRNKFVFQFIPEINSFVYDTLKEIVKHAALHMAILMRSDVKLPITNQEERKIPWYINGYGPY